MSSAESFEQAVPQGESVPVTTGEQTWRFVPDPELIEEDPEVERDPAIRKLRGLLSSGWPRSHLLKSKEG